MVAVSVLPGVPRVPEGVARAPCWEVGWAPKAAERAHRENAGRLPVHRVAQEPPAASRLEAVTPAPLEPWKLAGRSAEVPPGRPLALRDLPL